MRPISLVDGPPVEFETNNHKYNCNYFLADDIYPRWNTFVKPVVKPKGKRRLDFHNSHAGARKDVVRAFEILRAQFSIVRGPAGF
jgi:hypothetical protein